MSASEGEKTIRRLYDALDRHDGETMAACYAPNAHFNDPVFNDLTGEEAGDMWRMLTSRSEDLAVELADCRADDERGIARWMASYTFTATGREVVNDVQASFRFEGGLIVEHIDRFDLWKWTRQALGPTGVLLGWSAPVQSKVRNQAAENLREFRAGRAKTSSEPLA